MRCKLQEDLECFEHWGELNDLHLNIKKTRFLFTGTRSKLNGLHDAKLLRLYVFDVVTVKQYNYLGV